MRPEPIREMLLIDFRSIFFDVVELSSLIPTVDVNSGADQSVKFLRAAVYLYYDQTGLSLEANNPVPKSDQARFLTLLGRFQFS